MKYKIGVFGSGGSSSAPANVKDIAKQLGSALGRHHSDVIVITGGCSGLPYIAAHEAAQNNSEVWGFSPVISLDEQKEFTPDDDLSIYTKLEFVPDSASFSANRRVSMKYRNVLSTSECDAGIIISGQWGSLNEFTNLLDMQKLVGVLTGTGGISDELEALCQKIHKDGQGEIVFDSDPKALVEKILVKLS